MVDYSAWGKIDVSDDEDDTHPSIDTPSLFRLRHMARVDKMKDLEEAKAVLAEMKEMLSKKKESGGEELEQLETQVEELGKEVEIMEKRLPWNVDTLSTDKFSRGFVNKGGSEETLKITHADYESFVEQHKTLLESFGVLSSLLESKKFLEEHPELLSICTSEFLLKEAIASCLEEEEEKTCRLCAQCVTIHLLLRMAEELKTGQVQSLVPLYFTRIAQELPAFHEEVLTLRKRVGVEADDRSKELRLGPGGLDPLEVAEELPEDLRQCFILRDEELLKSVVAKMDPGEAERLIERCVGAGLWIPGPSDTPTQIPNE